MSGMSAEFIESVSHYKSWKCDPTTWVITTASCVGEKQYMYLLEGEERALLIDTGYGFGELGEYCASLTDKPVIAAVTHGHFDHVLGNKYFNQVYMSEYAPGDIGECPEEENPFKCPDTEYVVVHDGDSVDLGNRSVRVFEMPAHALSSLYFLDEQRGYLFTGDELDGQVVIWYFTQKVAPDYRGAAALHRGYMQRLAAILDEISYVLPAHYCTFVNKEVILDYMKLDELMMADMHHPTTNLAHPPVETDPKVDRLRRATFGQASYIYRLYD